MAKPTEWKNLEDIGRDLEVLEKILPWFEWRMSYDCWSFGLLLTTGHVVEIEQLGGFKKDSSGKWWVDVTLMDNGCGGQSGCGSTWDGGGKVLRAPTSRKEASIAVDQIVMAVELADT